MGPIVSLDDDNNSIKIRILDWSLLVDKSRYFPNLRIDSSNCLNLLIAIFQRGWTRQQWWGIGERKRVPFLGWWAGHKKLGEHDFGDGKVIVLGSIVPKCSMLLANELVNSGAP